MRLDHLLSGNKHFISCAHTYRLYLTTEIVEREPGERRKAFGLAGAALVTDVVIDGLAQHVRMRGSVAQLVRAPS